MKLRNLMALSVLIVTVPMSGPQAAASSHQPKLKELTAKLKEACQSDIDKNCKGVTQGEGRIASCLEEKEDQLSSKCQSTWTKTKTEVSRRIDKAEVAFRRDCGSDVQKFCADVPSGKGRLLECLDEHQEGLSNSCQKFEAELMKKLTEFVG